MKINEITAAKITQMKPGQSAEIDNGDGTKTVVDLKKNPTAIQKDASTGKVKLNKKPKPGGKPNPATQVKPGDEVAIQQ